MQSEQLKVWWLLSGIVLLLSIQALLMVKTAVDLVSPCPQVVLFLFWLIFFIVGEIIAAYCFRKRQTAAGGQNLRAYLIVEAILTFLLLSGWVKMIFYDYRVEMARRAFDVLLMLAVLNKLCWPQISGAGKRIYALLYDRSNSKILGQLIVVGGTLLLALIIFVPDNQRVLARMYMGEQFLHYEMFVMATGWAAFNKHIFYVDQISQYGMGMPYVFAQLTRWMGGFSHEHVFLVLMTAVIFYYVLMFWFSLRWFKSAALTLAMMLWGIRVQMFHPGVYPFIFTYPSATVVRYFFDLFVLAAIFCHLQRGNPGWLWAAGLLSGFAVFYMDSTGVFLLAAFYAYLVCLLIMPYTRTVLYKTPRDLVVLAIYFLWPVAAAFGFYYMVAGQHLFTAQFWRNLTEFSEYFLLTGKGTLPIYENFKYHNFWAGLVGLIIPAVWVFTIIYVGAMCYFKKFSRRNIFIIVVCVYGLGINHYYIMRAVLTTYYVTALPFIFVCGYWLKILFWSWPRRKRSNAVLVLLAVSFYALFTNHNFMSYPNVFNWSHNPMVDPLTAQPLPADLTTYFNHLYRNSPEDLKLPANSLGSKNEELYTEGNFSSDDDLAAYYHQDFDFSKDAQLIRSLTQPGEEAALISSFEVKILIQADRPPFFYYFPLSYSRSKHMRTMPLDSSYTNVALFNRRTIDQLRVAQPEYIFLEKIFLYNFPKAYADKPENLIPIVSYVRAHYAPYIMGEYVVAMKRKMAGAVK